MVGFLFNKMFTLCKEYSNSLSLTLFHHTHTHTHTNTHTHAHPFSEAVSEEFMAACQFLKDHMENMDNPNNDMVGTYYCIPLTY